MNQQELKSMGNLDPAPIIDVLAKWAHMRNAKTATRSMTGTILEDRAIYRHRGRRNWNRVWNHIIAPNKEDVLRISINLPENGELKVAVSSDSESEGFLSSQDNYISYEKDNSISIPSHTDNSHTLTVITPLHIS